VGVGIGLIGGWLLGLARRKDWMAESFQQIGVVTLPLLCLVVSEMVGASMFIAAFVAGLAVQVGFKETSRHSLEFAEELGQILNLLCSFSSACSWSGTGGSSTLLRCYTRLSV